MELIEETIYYNNLLNIYKNLLTHKQLDIMELYFLYNLSLREIAENKKITHNAVEYSIKNSMRKLQSYEASLHLYEKKTKILKNTAKLKENLKNNEKINLLNEIEEVVNNGI